MSGQPHVEVYERIDGLYDWRMVGGNGETMFGTDQGFTERNDAEEALAAGINAMSNRALEIRII